MRYFDKIVDGYVYPFENVVIAPNETIYIPYILPVNFFLEEYQLIADSDGILTGYSLSVAVPPNGIIDDSQDDNRVFFKIAYNFHHYLQIYLFGGYPPS